MYISSELTMIDAIDAIRKQFMIFVYLKQTTGDRPKYRIYIALISTRYTSQLIVLEQVLWYSFHPEMEVILKFLGHIIIV